MHRTSAKTATEPNRSAFAANRFATSGMLGCSAKVNALFSGEALNFGAIARTPPSRSGDASAAVGTTAVPGAFSAIDHPGRASCR